jgi:tetratricopeptide (TPR) repeat protein
LDLYFQGVAWLNKGPIYVARARSFFEKALTLDPNNVEALVGLARATGSTYWSDDSTLTERLISAEATLIKALSLTPQYARGQMELGVVQMNTNHIAQGIAECERALVLDRNLADAHSWIGFGKYHSGRAAETESHIHEALRLSPRDTHSYRWLMILAFAKLVEDADCEAVIWLRRSLEANPNNTLAHCALAGTLALLGKLDEARAAAHAGLALDPTFTIRRIRRNIASGGDPTYLAKRELIIQSMHTAGVPEG